jgi:hypothetical protein
MSGFIIKMMIFFHQRLVSRPMFSDVGGSPAEARFFFNGMMGNLQQTRIVGEKR